MNKQIFENGIRYVRNGDCYLPDLKLNKEKRPIGHYGRLRREYLREHRPVLFNQLVLADKLWTHLADTQEAAQSQLDLLICQMAAAEGVNEGMKEESQMEWVQRMNNIRSRAEEIILSELICE